LNTIAKFVRACENQHLCSSCYGSKKLIYFDKEINKKIIKKATCGSECPKAFRIKESSDKFSYSIQYDFEEDHTWANPELINREISPFACEECLMENCDECEKSAKECTACNTEHILNNGECGKSCPRGMLIEVNWKQQKYCKACSDYNNMDGCLECDNSTTCTKCAKRLLLQTDPRSRQRFCIKECMVGHFLPYIEVVEATQNIKNSTSLTSDNSANSTTIDNATTNVTNTDSTTNVTSTDTQSGDQTTATDTTTATITNTTPNTIANTVTNIVANNDQETSKSTTSLPNASPPALIPPPTVPVIDPNVSLFDWESEECISCSKGCDICQSVDVCDKCHWGTKGFYRMKILTKESVVCDPKCSDPTLFLT